MTTTWHSQGEADLPGGRDWLSPFEALRASSMRFTKRRSEWVLARWTAKRALAQVLGLPADEGGLARIEIRPIVAGPARGAPEVFVEGRHVQIGISSTDRAGWAACILGEVEAIGCDLELVEARSGAFVRTYLTPGEQEEVAAPPFEASPDLMANLIWSAKESALKVLRTGLRRDTRTVEVDVSPAAGPAPADGWRPLVVRSGDHAPFSGWWRQYGEFLLTTAAAAELPPPDPLLRPPGLASAVPSHSWMASPLAPDAAITGAPFVPIRSCP